MCCSRKYGYACNFSEKGQKRPKKILKPAKKGWNIWKFGKKCTKFENIFQKSGWLGVIIPCNAIDFFKRPWLCYISQSKCYKSSLWIWCDRIRNDNIHRWCFSSRITRGIKKRNKDMCKNGSGKENETQFKQNRVYA